MTATDGRNAALGKRTPWKARARVEAFRVLRLAGRRPGTHVFPDYLEFLPEARSQREFNELSARVTTYLGDLGLPLYLPGSRFDLDPHVVPYLEPSLVRDPGWVRERPAGRPYVLVHRLSPETVRAYLSSRAPGRVVDVGLHAFSEMEYFAARDEVSWPRYPPAETALERLNSLAGPGRSAFILATGPSALDVDLGAVAADVRITCNSAVRDLDRIREFRPTIIACTDPVFHFGPSRYSAQFRRDLIRAVEETDAYVLSGHDFAGPLPGMAPELADRLIVLPTQQGGPWRWPTARNPTVRLATSVLTNLMLPVAMMLADRIEIAGADGRQPSENYFWKHNPALQYSGELMETVFDAHPAFFRDRDYGDYYDQHCADIEALIRLAEGASKTVVGAAPSWIPALRARGAPEPRPA